MLTMSFTNYVRGASEIQGIQNAREGKLSRGKNHKLFFKTTTTTTKNSSPKFENEIHFKSSLE